jgi:hypothetical protein
VCEINDWDGYGITTVCVADWKQIEMVLGMGEFGSYFKIWTDFKPDQIFSVDLNRMLTRIFGPKRGGVTGEWRKLHNEELRDLYSSPGIIRIIKSRRMRWAGNVTRMWKKMNTYRLLVGKPEGKRPLERQDKM